MTLSVTTLVLSIAAVSFEPTGMCSVRELRNSAGYRWTVERIGEFVDRAAVIVRAKAIAPDSLPLARQDSVRWLSAVRFEVLQSIRDSVPRGQLVLWGRLVEADDFNRMAVPYQMVRPGGQGGDCYASEYKLGAEYLLLLSLDARGLNVRWMPLAPLNEQVRGADDPWVQWVRGRASHRPASPGA
ncbi:MAG: hypothetical protein H7Z74_02415 [Anaerolineae bacterium]|nr:hypothetical protein [Gemmatimonadaceae bacterium]